MKYKLISLHRTPERLEFFYKKNKYSNHFELFSAIDGNILLDQNFDLTNLISDTVNYSKGAIGCALSHFALWNESIKENEYLTICEDDAILHPKHKQLITEQIKKIPKNWDIILWGWNFDSFVFADFIPNLSPCLLHASQDMMKININDYFKSTPKIQCYRLRQAFGTVCYSISPNGARKLTQNIQPIREENVYFHGLEKVILNNGIDIALNHFYEKCNAFISFPPVCLTENSIQNSTIQVN